MALVEAAPVADAPVPEVPKPSIWRSVRFGLSVRCGGGLQLTTCAFAPTQGESR